MRRSPHAALWFSAFLITAVPSAADGPPAPQEPRPDEFLLVESELAHLPAAQRLITLEAQGVAAAKILDEIGKQSGLTIKVLGSLPAGVVLSPSFRNAKAGVALKWFAEQVRVQFRAQPPDTLEIFVEPSKVAPKRSMS